MQPPPQSGGEVLIEYFEAEEENGVDPKTLVYRQIFERSRLTAGPVRPAWCRRPLTLTVLGWRSGSVPAAKRSCRGMLLQLAPRELGAVAALRVPMGPTHGLIGTASMQPPHHRSQRGQRMIALAVAMGTPPPPPPSPRRPCTGHERHRCCRYRMQRRRRSKKVELDI
ncbi:uncharacterized protein PITG_02406 [Phytophthora infestans T30-4]|uniref:Uncharacterized protein n=1 Tax=Phytophthora infestans (strain T30-4) TaxID=403677 RepID=D0MW84_PHYIT|nr:uncharacterized protein PITG_02406 [Phytophthora infestans T30-4]EEY63897.1 hypothetical protein PITG_02406 [Phytophthora infestans T30-4]|eukprot:XP_002907333.1 hypothetical protein PITG_02406 [Phytophthora infestans T30-4]